MSTSKNQSHSASAAPTRSNRPPVSQDKGDAPPASQGRYAAAATTARDVDRPTSRFIAPQASSTETCEEDLMGTIQLIFDNSRRDKMFPQRVETLPSTTAPTRPSRYRLQLDYATHLTMVMELVSNTLNEFLRAAESPRPFSFGSSKYYGNHSFEELVHSNWPTQAIVYSLERRLLLRIQGAHIAITRFMYKSATGIAQLISSEEPVQTSTSP
jgi:hypothetical protein